MLTIGEMSRRTGVKVPTIRYYEETGLLPAPGRTAGNQRRYDADGLARLEFIRHARALGFSIADVRVLIALQDHPDRSCAEATEIARAQLVDVRDKITRLQRLETELTRLSDGCDGGTASAECYVLAALSDHGMCETEH